MTHTEIAFVAFVLWSTVIVLDQIRQYRHNKKILELCRGELGAFARLLKYVNEADGRETPRERATAIALLQKSTDISPKDAAKIYSLVNAHYYNLDEYVAQLSLPNQRRIVEALEYLTMADNRRTKTELVRIKQIREAIASGSTPDLRDA